MQTSDNVITEQIIKTLLSVVDAGLVCGLGKPIPGNMCVEAAVCYALGLPHGDDPKCVGSAVRAFKIGLNDSGWSSDLSRAAGMRKLAVAQLGSDVIDQKKFIEYVILQTISRILPKALRFKELEERALDCEKVETLNQAIATIISPYINSLDSSTYSAVIHADEAVKYISIANPNTEASATYIAMAALWAAAVLDSHKDIILQLSAQIALEALQAQDSPGCKWLYLCE